MYISKNFRAAVRLACKAFACTALLLSVPLAVPAQTENASVIIVDPSAPAQPFPHFWEQIFGSGRAILALRDNYRQDLRETEKITGLRYVRFHAIFHDEVGVYDENEQATQTEAAVKIDPVAMGKRLFSTPTACIQCHQATGLGIAGTYPPLAGSEFVNGPDDRIIRILLDGLKGPVKVKGTTFPGVTVMPSFGPSGFNWTDDKIADVLTYVRQEWGNKAPPVDAAKVAQIRQQVATHEAWTAEEILQIK